MNDLTPNYASTTRVPDRDITGSSPTPLAECVGGRVLRNVSRARLSVHITDIVHASDSQRMSPGSPP